MAGACQSGNVLYCSELVKKARTVQITCLLVFLLVLYCLGIENKSSFGCSDFGHFSKMRLYGHAMV